MQDARWWDWYLSEIISEARPLPEGRNDINVFFSSSGGATLREEAAGIAVGAGAGITGMTEGVEAVIGLCGLRSMDLLPGLTIVSLLRTSVAR